jgi:hypothetical protein
LERGLRTGVEVLIDVTRVPGPTASSDRLIGSRLDRSSHNARRVKLVEQAWRGAHCWEVGAPQMQPRHRCRQPDPASPVTTPSQRSRWRLRLRSARGEREPPRGFLHGVRRTVMAEVDLTGIR